jgi:hypothetical protein
VKLEESDALVGIGVLSNRRDVRPEIRLDSGAFAAALRRARTGTTAQTIFDVTGYLIPAG